MAKTKNSMLDAKTKTSKESGNTNITRKDTDPVEQGLSLYRKIKLFNANFQEEKAKEEAKKKGTEPQKVYRFKNETYDAWVRNAANLNDLKAFAELYEKLDTSFYEFRTTHRSMQPSEIQDLINAAVKEALEAAGVISQKSADRKTARTAAKAARKEEVEESE